MFRVWETEQFGVTVSFEFDYIALTEIQTGFVHRHNFSEHIKTIHYNNANEMKHREEILAECNYNFVAECWD